MKTVASSFVGVAPAQHSQKVRVIVPTYNAQEHWADLQASLDRQGIPANHILIVDSSSRDETVTLAKRAGYQVLTIRKEEFGHGATRQLAVNYFSEADLLVFLTQDAALPDGDALSHLCRALLDPAVGAAYGRQAPRNAAGPIERHARWFNYPERSHVRTFESREQCGIKAAFCSNSFAVYRRSALMAVGGFPTGVLLAEDSVVAARLLMAGWKVAYEASAVAVHSHPLSLRQEFSRYFDTGAHHAREMWLLETFGEAVAEGKLFVRSELHYLLRCAPQLIPLSLLRTCSKLAAYRLGRLQGHLPHALTLRLSGYPAFWSGNRRQALDMQSEPHQPAEEAYGRVLADSLAGVNKSASI